MQVIIDFGETRHIMLEVVSIKNDEFVISQLHMYYETNRLEKTKQLEVAI